MKKNVLAAAISFLICSLAVAQQPFVVEGIEIVGNTNVPTQEILKAVGFKTGDTADASQVKAAAQAIEALGYFAKVTPELSVEEGKVVVRFKVVEYPKIERITLLGVEGGTEGGTLWAVLREWLSTPRVSESRIRSILKEHDISPGQVLNRIRLQEALKEVLEEYRKKDLATVQIGQVIPGEELVIEIQELPVLGHRFSGLSTVPEEAAAGLVSVPPGKVGRYSQIQASLRRLANSVYFSSANVVPELEGKGVWLRWELTERVLLPQPQPLAGIELVGAEAIPPERLSPHLGPLPQGTATNYDALKALSGVYDYYRREGYFMVDFLPAGLEAGVLKVKVLEGKIDEIRIEGEHTTQERVIRRVMALSEGEFLTEARFAAARQHLMALGYFSDVALTPRWEGERLLLSVKVTELKKLGQVGGSMAFSPNEGLVGNLQYSQKNILGTGQDLTLTFSKGLTGTASTTWTVGYQGHAFPVYDLVALDLYREAEPQDDTTKVTFGGNLSLAYPIAPYLDLSLGLISEQAKLLPEGVSFEPRNALRVGLLFDSRDSPFFPRTGSAGSLVLEKAGTFAPGVEYLSLDAELARFVPVDLGDVRAAFAARAVVKLGWDLPQDYQFELGGVSSVRGAQTSYTDHLALLNSELRFELAEGFSLSLFWDLGTDFGEKLKSSAGIELSAYIAGMFLRIDMAWPSDRAWSWVPVFEFDMSPMF
ncbi:MAG: Surface antigen [Acetothermia bacterium 64_32]|nr:MAG: Surface antigen [Acetothermia bacterium 64_32]HAF69856.1 hypothetical protein [Candidatus Acetothermia bacterium]